MDARHLLPPGSRFLALLLLLVAVGGCRSLHLSTAGFRADDEWLTEGGGTDRANTLARTIEAPLEQVWEFKTTGGFGPASALLLNNSVLVSTRKGEVQAIEIETGRGLGVVGFGESIDGGSVIDAHGTMYVPVSWGRRGLHAFDLTTGNTRWKVKRVPVNAGLLLAGDRLIVADVQSLVSSHDPRTGEVLWERTLSDRAAVHGAPVLAENDIVVVGTDEGQLHGLLLSDGSQLWETSLGAPVYVSPAGRDGTVYVATTRGRLLAIDSGTGSEVFSVDLGNPEIRLSAPAVSPSAVVFGGSDGVLRAVDPVSGSVLWTFAGGEAIGAAPLIAGDVVYAGDMGKKLRAIDLSDGHLLWETELGGRIKSAMAAAGGRIVVLAEARSVYLFRSSTAHVASK